MALPFPTPGSLAPAFALSPVTTADAESLARIYYASFATDPGNTYWWPADPGPMLAWMVTRIRRKIANPGVRHYKITHQPTGDMVAFARWDVPAGSTGFGAYLGEGDDDAAAAAAVDVSGLVREGEEEEEEEEEKKKTQGLPPPPATTSTDTTRGYADLEIPPGADEALCRGFFDALARASKKWVKSDMLGLSLLATNPNYFGQGAARALMLPMLDIADREGRKTYLEATPAGRPLYEKWGFRVVDVLEFNLDELTTDQHGLYKVSIMIREPNQKK